jgi:uncharacterized protein YoaH (UPF0181 family)
MAKINSNTEKTRKNMNKMEKKLFFDRLDKVLMHKGMSLSALEVAVQIQGTLIKARNEGRIPSHKILKKITDYFEDVDIRFLLGETDEKTFIKDNESYVSDNSGNNENIKENNGIYMNVFNQNTMYADLMKLVHEQQQIIKTLSQIIKDKNSENKI